MLRRLLGEEEVLVADGFIYLPLLFDPAIDEEMHDLRSKINPQAPSGQAGEAPVIQQGPRYFVKSLSLKSLLANYALLEPEVYKRVASHYFSKYVLRTEAVVRVLSGKLKTIIFEILPHFVHRTSWQKKRGSGEDDILGLLSDRLLIPADYRERAGKILDPQRLAGDLTALGKNRFLESDPPTGLIKGRDLRQWFYQALAGEILARKKARWQEAVRQLAELVRMSSAHLPLLLYLAEADSLEVDGFGFSRIGSRDDYLIYKRSGEYALKDYYGRLYLFPDCRVAVSTSGPLRPMVLEKYKHPFLLHYRTGQSICLRGFRPGQSFTAQNVITALEEGLNALFHGYDYRRRNGYHSLDHLPQSEDTITFDDYRISTTHPKILSGEIEVKNDFR